MDSCVAELCSNRLMSREASIHLSHLSASPLLCSYPDTLCLCPVLNLAKFRVSVTPLRLSIILQVFLGRDKERTQTHPSISSQCKPDDINNEDFLVRLLGLKVICVCLWCNIRSSLEKDEKILQLLQKPVGS